MNCFYFDILLAFSFWTLTVPSEAFIARSTGCHHNGTWYADKSLIPTIEKCLNCQCNKKTLVCRLKVCPEMPIPPPRGCVVVQKKNTCCPYLSCARLEAFYKIPITRRIIAYLDHYERESIDRVVNDNMLQRRSDDSEADLLVCVKNGTVYKSGSAMSSSNLCSYCYCIGGTEKCVKPKCMLPVEGCKPIFVDSTCCPVRYDCSVKSSGKSSQEVRYRKTANKHFLRMSQRLQRNRGCTVNKQFYAEGQKMKSDPDKPCDICFCIRGSRRCAPKKCSPPLKNCMPVVPKGQCCPSSYDCGSQRDYRRSHNSRQFNLFSLLFGKDEIKPGPSTDIPAQYPHDRDPALTASANKYKTHELALEASSEKSILDTIREGLEFIDGNSNHMLEENLDLVNLQAKRESLQSVESTTSAMPGEAMSSTSELSFLDLILGESNDQDSNKHDEIAIPTPSTPIKDELSWVDILLGPSKEQQNKTISEQNISNSEISNTSTNIERLDFDMDELGSSGEIIVGSAETFIDSTTEATNILSGSKTAMKPAEPSTESGEHVTTVNNTTYVDQNQDAGKLSITNATKPVYQKLPIIRPIPVYDSSEHTQRIEYIPIKEVKTNNKTKSETTVTTAQKNDLLTAFLDGISDILNTEKSENGSSIINTTTQVLASTETSTRPTESLPHFKPLPTQIAQTHTRINSKISNLVVSPPTILKKDPDTQKITIRPLPSILSKLEHSLKSNNITSTTSPTPTTTTTTYVTTKASITTKTTSNTHIITTTPKITTPKPLIIKTNPTILEADPLDDSTEPTLPPSLPNLKIIPFLPTDAVETENTKVYEYFPANSPPYEDAKIYPDITKNYGGYAVDLEDDNKAKYIYKFKVEGPEVDAVIEASPKIPTDAVGVESFLKYDFSEKNGFSPPTKTEGGFVPKEPIPIDDEIFISGDFNTSKLNEIFPATMHIIDLTTPEPFEDNLTKIIEITTPDPFKDVIHTEPPPDLTLIIQDKKKIEAMAQKSQNPTSNLTHEIKSVLKQNNLNNSIHSLPIHSSTSMVQDKNDRIETFLDLLFKEEKEIISDVGLKNNSSTIPPFKILPQATLEHVSSKPTESSIIKKVKDTDTDNQTTRRPLHTKSTQVISSKNPTKSKITQRPTTTLSTKANNLKINKTPTKMSTTPSTATTTEISSSIKTTKLPVSIPKATKPTSKTTKPTITTITTSIKTTQNPFLMSPFNKLPFMDTSFEIKRKTPPTIPSSTTKSHSLEKLEGLDAAYEISNGVSSTIATTSTLHTPYAAAVNEKHSTSTSTSNSLIDPTGILKLAGCNIYGRMYRVGRIILELSSPCVECKCTETGVKCGQLDC